MSGPARAAYLILAALMSSPAPATAADAPLVSGARAVLLDWADVSDWRRDALEEVWPAFRASCAAMADRAPALRPGAPTPAALEAVCRVAQGLPENPDSATVRVFFEQHFTPFRVVPETGGGFLTGYFEPVIEGSLEKSEQYSAPVYGRPDDLVTLLPGQHPAGFDTGLAAARRTPDGLVPYIDRKAIYAGGLSRRGLEVLYLRDEAEVFITQVQGSARVRLPDGRMTRLVYAGRTGHPYTSIGRILIETGRISREEMSLARLMRWLRANPAEARAVMEQNRSYVFFARDDTLDPALGPVGGAGVPLTPGRSLAVDRSIWAYGLPVFIAANVDTLAETEGRLARLMIAQDTGSAIVGPARADYFWGTGVVAGERAGVTRHALDFIVLWPKAPRP